MVGRNEWVEAGARVIIKRGIRRSMMKRGLDPDFTGASMDLLLDMARTVCVDEVCDVVTEWRKKGVHLMRLGDFNHQSNGQTVLQSAELAEAVLRDIEAKL